MNESLPGGGGPVILAVDDDPLILASLRALFTVAGEYELITCESPEDAERVVRSRPIDVVISDFLMPGVNGVELLKRIRRLQPEAPRILLTGFADTGNAIRGINEAGLYHYLEKPWENENLLLVVRNALAEQDLRRRLSDKARELERLIQKHESLRDQHQGRERELEMAARVQRSLLPSKLPTAHLLTVAGRYEPSAVLGGDFYDVHIRDSQIILIVADVSGHGPPAALAAMLLKAGFHEAAEMFETPAELLSGMNGRLSRFLPDGMFACAAVAALDGAAIEIANAGLPHPRVRRAAGEVQRIAINGLPLGLLPEASPRCYDRRRIELQRGDLLLLATDGLGEARDDAGRYFDDAALDQNLAEAPADPERLLDTLLQAGRDHLGGAPFKDDVTALAIARRP